MSCKILCVLLNIFYCTCSPIGLRETTESIVKKKVKEKDNQNPWEKYLEKKKDKQVKKWEEKKNKVKQVKGNVYVQTEQHIFTILT